MSRSISFLLLGGMQIFYAMPALAVERICAQSVAVTSISTGTYDDDSRTWGVSYIDNEGNVKVTNSTRGLQTPEGEDMLRLLEGARRHGNLVAFKRFSDTCAVDGVEWFDHISVN